jgi:hypothetical protein
MRVRGEELDFDDDQVFLYEALRLLGHECFRMSQEIVERVELAEDSPNFAVPATMAGRLRQVAHRCGSGDHGVIRLALAGGYPD